MCLHLAGCNIMIIILAFSVLTQATPSLLRPNPIPGPLKHLIQYLIGTSTSKAYCTKDSTVLLYFLY